jgi:hypothetical protein
MRFLTYDGLVAGDLGPQLDRVRAAFERDDLAAVDLRKLAVGGLYRARLSDRARLILKFVTWQGQRCALALEVLANHEYEKSRFLKGARVDEARIEPAEAPAQLEASPMKYVHPTRAVFSMLDKPLSFDDTQDEVLRRRPPLVLVGSAGSGKTALLLHHLRRATGRVAYLTESAWLAESARSLYVANDFDPGDQEADFLSYRQLLESIAVPEGTAVSYRRFVGFFERHRQKLRFTDAHRCFEELRGVLTADPSGPLSREAYLGLGVRLSLFSVAEREQLYDFFERYLEWLPAERAYEPNLVAHAWAARATPRYDFLAIDEVQDLTPVQLALALRLLQQPGAFIVAGDANQVVHPNFFAWSKVKTLFWQGLSLPQTHDVAVLEVSYRNAPEVTRVANALLTLKNVRFGSIDRESTTILRPVEGEAGEVRVLPTTSAAVTQLDARTRRSTEVAVVVLREEDKAEARARFGTPLIFSVLESKGLEYEHVILHRFISGERRVFSELAEGLTPEALRVDGLTYSRAKDKADKTSEAYKFFINALYVALTRAVKNVWLIEDDPAHPLLTLLGVAQDGERNVAANITQSSTEAWQREAQRLEAHGKAEQVEAIRSAVLRVSPTPRKPIDEAATLELIGRALDPRGVSNKAREQLADALAFHPDLFAAAHLEAIGFRTRASQRTLALALLRRVLEPFEGRKFKGVLENTEKYGVEYRSMNNLTPLMLAAFAGNLPLVEALLDRGARVDARDHYGLQPLHWALRRAETHPDFVQGSFGAMWERLAPPSFDVQVSGRLVQVGREQGEYLVFQLMLARAFRSDYLVDGSPAGLKTADLLHALEAWPEVVIRPYRKKRPYLSSMLSKNERHASGYSRQLFARQSHGFYVINPDLKLRERGPEEDAWAPIGQVMRDELRRRPAELYGLLLGRPFRFAPEAAAAQRSS